MVTEVVGVRLWFRASRMAHVNALSNAPDLPATESDPAVSVMNINVGSDDWVLIMQFKDEKLMNSIGILRGQRASEDQIETEYVLKNNRRYRKTQQGAKLVISKAVSWRIAKYCHDDVGHYGLQKGVESVQQTFWFFRMQKYMREYIAACVECSYNKAKGGNTEVGYLVPLHFP